VGLKSPRLPPGGRLEWFLAGITWGLIIATAIAACARAW